MEIRMNDKIQIEGTVIADCGEYFHMRIAPNVTAYDLKKTWVTKIVERAETDAEKIARLEKSNAEYKLALKQMEADRRAEAEERTAYNRFVNEARQDGLLKAR
jgi:hypothetical protein